MNSSFKIIFSVILLFFAPSSSIFASIPHNVDSLIKVVDQMKGLDKLEALSIISNYRGGNLDYINRLEAEAKLQSSEHYLGSAYFYKLSYYFWQVSNNDSIHYYYDKSKTLDNISDKMKFNFDVSLVMIYTTQGQFEIAIFYLKNILEKGPNQPLRNQLYIYNQIASIYLHSKKYSEAKIAIAKGKEIFDRCDFSPVEKIINAGSIPAMEIYIAMEEKEYDLALEILDSRLSEIEVLYGENEEASRDNRDLMMLLKAEIYLAKDELSKARQQLDICAAMISLHGNNGLNILSQNTLESKYHYKMGNYEKALESINVSIEGCKQVKSILDVISGSYIKSDILHAQGKYDEAYKLLHATANMQDSLSRHNSVVQLGRIQSGYEIAMIKERMTQNALRAKIITLGLSLISILLLAILIIKRQKNKIAIKKNKKIYQQNLLMNSYAQKIREQDKASNADDRNDNAKAVSLADRIEDYLKETKAFKNNDLSRNELALALGTNRQYLTDAIREKTGKTFKDYIDDIRLAYAYNILLEDHYVSIIEVYTESGFASRSTFNRLFREKYEMSPNELRDVVKNEGNMSDAISELTKEIWID